MIVKEHINQGRLILAICDKALLGKIFEEHKKVLDLSSSFFDGSEIDNEILLEKIKQAHMVNAVGRYTIQFLIKNNLVEDKEIMTINNVPYIMVIVQSEN